MIEDGPCSSALEAVVYCKDCTNGVIYCDNGDIICDHVDSNGNDTHLADWFCADGEMKKEVNKHD